MYDSGGEGGVRATRDWVWGVPILFIEYFSGAAARFLPDLKRSPFRVVVASCSLPAFLSWEPFHNPCFQSVNLGWSDFEARGGVSCTVDRSAVPLSHLYGGCTRRPDDEWSVWAAYLCVGGELD